MKNNQFYALLLAFPILSTQPSFAMESPTRAQHVLTQYQILEQLHEENPLIDLAAQQIEEASLSLSLDGRMYFNRNRYEQHLDNNPDIPWQALFMANSSMLSKIQLKAQMYDQRLEKDREEDSKMSAEQFVHFQRATIYCEIARELLKRNCENNGTIRCIASLKNWTLVEYAKAHQDEHRAALRGSIHRAQHRWNDCRCSKIHTAALSRNN